ncbi:hypothetical protein TWF281_005973 [Arthrobotrys megalospora]
MEHFAPFTANHAPARYETAELNSSMTLVEDAVRQRNEGLESYELDGQGHSGYGLDNLHEMPVPGFGGSSYAYTELPTRPSTTSPMNDASSPLPRQTVPPSRSAAGASPTLNTPFDAFDTSEFYWNTNPSTASAVPPTAAQPQYPRPPRRRFRPVESPQFLPEYVIDNFLKANPDQDGFFCVFKKTYVLKSDGKTIHEGPLPANQTTLWRADKVIGHLFEVTRWGSMVFHGPFQDNEREFTGYWGKKSTIKEVKKPMDDAHSFLHIPIPYSGNSVAIPLDSLSTTNAQSLAKPRQTFSSTPQFATFQGSDLVNLMVSRYSGSWKRIFNTVGYRANPTLQHDNKFTGSTHGILALYSNIPKLIALIVAMGKIHPRQLFKYISLSPENMQVQYGQDYTSRPSGYDFYPFYQYPSVSLRIPLAEWEDQGWMYTEVGSLEVLIS